MHTELRLKKRLADFQSYLRRERLQVLPAGTDEDCRFDRAEQIIHSL
jgi:hypothetical protein